MNPDNRSTKLLSDQKHTYRRLLAYAAPYKGRLFLGLFFGLLLSVANIGLVQSLRDVVKNFISTADLTVSQMLAVAAALPLFGALWGVAGLFSRYLVGWVGQRVVMDLRVETFNRLQKLSLKFFSSNNTGEIISRTTNDTMMVERGVSRILIDLAREPFALIGMVGYVLYTNWKLALISLVVFPICLLPATLFGRRVRRLAKEGQQHLADLVTIMQETTTGVRVVKAYCAEEREQKRYAERARGVFRRAVKISIALNALEPIVVCIAMTSVSAIFVFAWFNKIPFDQILAFVTALFLMYTPAKKLSRIHLEIQLCSSPAERIFEILDSEDVEIDETATKPCPVPLREIRFEDVHFQYTDDAPVLQAINLSIKPGESLALVGSSGGGKSTLLSLIPRFYRVSSGRVLMNGEDINDMDLHSLRQQIGLVSQETVLFNDTVKNNIKYGRPDATDEEIQQAAEKAHAHTFVMEMPRGYDSIIGERGTQLSGGQCQRLAIARALLADRPILLLDEATSALDSDSEKQVQAALSEVMKNRTVIIVAHRLSTIKSANRIALLSNGRIVEEGNHEELMNQKGEYRRLYEMHIFDSNKSDV